MSKNINKDLFNLAAGKELMFFRSKAGLTRKQVCEELGVSKSRYTHFENGDFHVSFYHVLELCDLFGVTVIDLLQRMSKE